MGQLNNWIRQTGKIQIPVLGQIISCRQVQLVVPPVSREAIRGHDASSTLSPANGAVGVAVKVHPLAGEISNLRSILDLQVQYFGQCSSLHSYIHFLHPTHLLHPGEGVLCVQNQNEARAVASGLLSPELHDLIQTKDIPTLER